LCTYLDSSMFPPAPSPCTWTSRCYNVLKRNPFSPFSSVTNMPGTSLPPPTMTAPPMKVYRVYSERKIGCTVGHLDRRCLKSHLYSPTVC
jgi:hypothetical protein